MNNLLIGNAIGDFFIGGLRSIMFFLDKVIYSFISALYKFINYLAQMRIFEDDTIRGFANNIYAFTAIIMLFYLAFNIMSYIVNPDSFYESKKGMGSLIQRSIVVLFLVVSIPFGFEYAYKIQGQLMEDNRLVRIVFGNNLPENPEKVMASAAIAPFLDCNDPAVCDTTINTVREEGDLSIIEDINQKGGDGKYAYKYDAPLSTIVGIAVLYMLVLFSYDLALRAVKLSFLELIAPMPVISYIDPKSSQGGMFSKWLKLVKDTYLGLFIRILSIAFLVIILGFVHENKIFGSADELTKDATELLFLKLFIVIGALIFAKEAPKIIGDLFGTNMSASFGGLKALNPFGRMAGGGLIGGALGYGAGLGMKGIGYGSGALRGGLNSAFRKGSFVAGAIKGAQAGSKDIPLKGGLGKQVSSLWAGGRKAADAGASSAMGREIKTGMGNVAAAKINAMATSAELNRKATASIENGKSLRESIDSNSLYGKEAINNIKNSALPQIEKDKAIARVEAKATSSIIKNAEFRQQYENFALAKSFERVEKNELNRLEIELDNKKAQYQRGEISLQEVQDQEAKVGKQKIEVTKAEGSKTYFETIYTESSKLTSNAKDVKAIAELKAYDDYKKAEERIKPKEATSETPAAQPGSTTTNQGGTTQSNQPESGAATGNNNTSQSSQQPNDNRQVSIDDYMKTRTGTIDQRQMTTDDLRKNNQSKKEDKENE